MVKKKAKKADACCCDPHRNSCCSIYVIVLGALILLNALLGWLNWGVFIGGIVIIKGLLMLKMNNCCK